MTPFEKLVKLFGEFPGIGPRQARRFVYHLLGQERGKLGELSTLIETIKDDVTPCTSCMRYFARSGRGSECHICSDTSRNPEILTVVESDQDIQSIERSNDYDGFYFVLGGVVPLLESKENGKLNGGALKEILKKRIAGGLSEIILAFSVNPDGENTARYVESLLKDSATKNNLKVTRLGRGLSTGSELEYADPETIKNALRNRQ